MIPLLRVLFICLGSMATSADVLIQLFRVPANPPSENIPLRNT